MTRRTRFVAVVVLSIASCALAACGEGQSKPVNLHTIDWHSVTLPGSVCGASDPIRLHGGTAIVDSTRWPRYPRVTVDTNWDRVRYGDLDGDGRDEAVLGVDCNNGGGTAGGVLSYARVIFTAGRPSPRVVGVVTPQRRASPGQYPTLLQITIRRGGVVARESWYRRGDVAACCPSGRSTAVWAYRDGTLHPLATVLQAPRKQH